MTELHKPKAGLHYWSPEGEGKTCTHCGKPHRLYFFLDNPEMIMCLDCTKTIAKQFLPERYLSQIVAVVDKLNELKDSMGGMLGLVGTFLRANKNKGDS